MDIKSFSFDSFMEQLGMEAGCVTATDSSFVAGYAATQTEEAKALFREFEVARQQRLAEMLRRRLQSA
jgi:hypothetical protein